MIKAEVAGNIDKFHKIINGPDTPEKREYDEKYNQRLKEEYMKWAKRNNLPEHLLEAGWQEFLED